MTVPGFHWAMLRRFAGRGRTWLVLLAWALCPLSSCGPSTQVKPPSTLAAERRWKPVWVSPTGRSLAVSGATESQFYMARLAGGKVTIEHVPLAADFVGAASWLPDDAGVMVVVGRGSASELVVARPDARGLEWCVSGGNLAYCELSVSPSGHWVAVTRPNPSSAQPSTLVQVLDLRKGCEVAGSWPTSRGAYGLGLVWTGGPDRLFFPLWTESARNRIAVVRPDHATPPELRTVATRTQVDYARPSPDGLSVAYQTRGSFGGHGDEQLRLMTLADGEESILAEHTSLGQIVWSPDGSSLAFVDLPSSNLVAYDPGKHRQRLIAEDVSRLAEGVAWTEQGVFYLVDGELRVALPDGSFRGVVLDLGD